MPQPNARRRQVEGPDDACALVLETERSDKTPLTRCLRAFVVGGVPIPCQRRDCLSSVGTERVEEFLDSQWGHREGRTYNKNLSILRDFFKWAVLRGKLHGDPTLPIERAKKRDVHRETFSEDQRRAIIAAQEDVRDRLAVGLLLNFGLRKGALQGVQFKHFDHYRKRLTIFTKGERVREVPIPDPPFWDELGRLIVRPRRTRTTTSFPSRRQSRRAPCRAALGDPPLP